VIYNNSGVDAQIRAQRSHLVTDWDHAVSLYRTSVGFSRKAHPYLAIYRRNFASALYNRSELTDSDQDLDEAIFNVRLAVDIAKDPVSLAQSLGWLSRCLHKRFLIRFRIEELEDAISHFSRGVTLLPSGHSDIPLLLSNLAMAVPTRYSQFAVVKDIDDAICYYQRAVLLIPPSHHTFPAILNNLGLALFERFPRLHAIVDLEQAVLHHRHALQCVDSSHLYYPIVCDNLGLLLEERFLALKSESDLDDAIEYHDHAVRKTTLDGPRLPFRLGHLSESLFRRYDCRHNVNDLEDAITHLERAVLLLSNDHSRLTGLLYNLGRCLTERFPRFRRPEDFDEAILRFGHSSGITSGYTVTRLDAAHAWAKLAYSENRLHWALEAYSDAIFLLPQAAWLGFEAAVRTEKLLSGLGQDVTACAIELAEFDYAIMFADQGRSILWTQSQQLQANLDDLSRIDSALAAEFSRVSEALRRGSFRSTSDMVPMGVDIREETKLQHGLAIDWEKLVRRIRLFRVLKTSFAPFPRLNFGQLPRMGP
jgi:tetratricopeptide (TPR) repeat protein